MNDIRYDATQIQAMVRNMDDSKKRHKALKSVDIEAYKGALIHENETLHFNFPSIFALHADDKLDSTFFYMLNQKRMIEKGEITEEDASTEVGKKLFNRWVAPVISNVAPPTTESYAEYYKRTTTNK
jgi:hypothetical protein